MEEIIPARSVKRLFNYFEPYFKLILLLQDDIISNTGPTVATRTEKLQEGLPYQNCRFLTDWRKYQSDFIPDTCNKEQKMFERKEHALYSL